jgi:AcrR family transcriptional regulator
MTTKERIAREALYLFSAKGYAATSVRDIAAAVGIKDSSLYNHYKSKQEIFDNVIEKYSQSGAEKYFSFYKKDEITAESFEMFCNPELISIMGRQLFTSVVADDESSKLRQLLVTEMYHNEHAKKAYAEYLKEPLTWTTMLFERMMSARILVQTDAQVLAYEFMTPIYTLQTEYECGGITLDEALDFLNRHVTLFFGNYMIGIKQHQ